MKVFVSVGTHEQPFQRLLDAVAQTISARPEHEYVVQYGVGTWPVDRTGVAGSDYLDANAMRDALEWSDVLISQASPGNAFGAVAAGTWPLVLGRTRAAGEHVDDHQVRFARALEDLEYATDIRDASLLPQALDTESRISSEARAARIRRAAQRIDANGRAFRSEVWSVLGLRS